MSLVQQSLCVRIRTTESHAVPCQVRQHLVTVQRHRRTQRTSASKQDRFSEAAINHLL